MTDIGKIKTIRETADFQKRNPGTHTDFYEISEEEYDRIISIDNFRGKLNIEFEKNMPDSLRRGYGFYGANVVELGDRFYYTICTGNSCD